MWTPAVEGLDRVEALLRDAARCPGDPFLTEVAGHLIGAGGKRLRPALALLAAGFGPRPTSHLVYRAAAAVELVHVASLYHDDVMDEAATRRGVASVNARWTNRIAILGGDYLVARAAELCAPMGADAITEQATVLSTLVRGQLRECVGVKPGTDPERFYLGVVADKTAALFVLATTLGARASGASDEVVATLRAYGRNLGIAFQLGDDVRDVALPGSASGTDLRQGVRTLPVLRAMRRRGRLRRLLNDTRPAKRQSALTLLRRSPALDDARTEVLRYADRARDALAPLPEVPAREALAGVCDKLLDYAR
jgi:heptaprenyl diphosphate synthase